MGRGRLGDDALDVPRAGRGLVVDPESVRLDHQLPAATPARAVLLAGSAHPTLSWAPPADPVPLTVTVRDAGGAVVSLQEAASDDASVRVATALRPYTAYRVAIEAPTREPVGLAFETGPLEAGDWTAAWLEVPAGLELVTPFVGDGVASARLYLTGQGIVRASVNGIPVDPDRLDPSRTDSTRALYRAFDVTGLLHPGANRLGFVLGRGEWHRTGLPPRLLAELVLSDAAGGIRVVAPSASSTLLTSEIVDDEPFYLERHDPSAAGAGVAARARELRAAAMPADPDDPGTPAIPPSSVLPDTGPAVRTLREFPAVELSRGRGWRTFDVGVNIAGRIRLDVEGVPAGTVVGALHGEHLRPDGRVDTTNITMPDDAGRERQLVEFVVPDAVPRSLQGWFAYQGFRYVEVRGVPEEASVRVVAESLHSDIPPAGELYTDSPLVEELVARARRTALNNLHGVPEDCPTREQSAWTGDAASASDFLFSAFDLAGFAEKWLGDLVTSLQPDGALPAIAPDVRPERIPPDPAWGAALHRMLRAHWMHVGDEDLVRRTLPALRAWARYQLARVGDSGVVSGFDMSYGHDWLALEQTPPALIHTGSALECLETLARLEREVGDVSAAAEWVARAAEIRAAARRLFVDEEGRVIANGSQGALAVALDAGLLTDAEVPAVVAALAEAIRGSGVGITTGFALTRTLVDVLARHGESQLILDLLAKASQPGIGAMLADGPGTFWENWWIDPENTGTGSLDHVGLGAPFAAWVWRHLAGVRPTGRGWSSLVVEPSFVTGVDTLTLARETPRGPLEVAWRRESGTVTVTVQVPRGSEATLILDAAGGEVVGPGRHVRVVERVDAAAAAPVSAVAWTAPAIARVSADVDGPSDLLETAEVTAGESTIVELLDRLVCMPVPHAQTGRPVVLARATDASASPVVVLRLREPLDLGPVRFVYALIDQCLDDPGAVTPPRLTLELEDGSVRTATAKAWPAGYNRVTVDTGDLRPGSRLAAIRVGLGPRDAPAGTSPRLHSDDAVGAFHLGEVGASSRRRTW